ncbi:MAG TPA: DUF1080 domain-containing protein, partial [Tepidisphaeraceae bacterium]
MKLLYPLALILVLLTTALADDPKESTDLPKPGPDGKISLFNGKDLTGWYGDESVYHVDNGELVGKTEKGLKQNEFLKSRFSVGDFRLVCQMKLVPNSANSGIQFRSVPFKGNEMKGYQADAGAGWWAKLYEESGRGILVNDGGEKWVNKDDWNTYEVVAVGHHILVAINGHKTVDLEDEKGSASGIFGLQVHAGGPTEVHWKDMKLELNP